MPATFAKLVEPRVLEPLLVEATKNQTGTYGRRAALRILSYLRRVTPKVVLALQSGLKDDRHVQDATLEAITRFRYFEGNILPPLFAGLEHESAMVAYGTAKLLSIMGRHEMTSSQDRKAILEALAKAIQSSRSQRGVYRLMGSGSDESNEVRIVHETRLDHAFYQALLEVSGVL